jgi:hypothetical protein
MRVRRIGRDSKLLIQLYFGHIHLFAAGIGLYVSKVEKPPRQIQQSKEKVQLQERCYHTYQGVDYEHQVHTHRTFP